MPKRDAKHMEAQRERIVRAVLQCIAEKGVERTSIADICRKAGMSTGAVYLHYRDKNDLVSAALRYATTTDAALPESWSKLIELIASLGDQLGFDIAMVARIRLHLHAESVTPGQLHELYRPIMKRALDEWATTLRLLEERGEIRLRMSPLQTAGAIHALFDGLLWIALATDRPLEDIKADLAASLACLVEDLAP